MHHLNICSIWCSGLVLVIVWRWVRFETSLMLSYYIDHLHVCVQVKVCELTCSPRRPHRCCCSRCPCWPLLTAAHLTATRSLTDRRSPAACPWASRSNPSANPHKPRPVSRQCCVQWSNPTVNPIDALWIGCQLQQCSGEFLKLCNDSLQSKIRSTLTSVLYILHWLIRAYLIFQRNF